MNYGETKKHGETVNFSGHRMEVRTHDVTLPNGKRVNWEVVHTKEAVAVLVVDVGSPQIALLNNYRYAVDKWILELPAGLLEEGETHVQCAERELLEETGLVGKCVMSIGEFHLSPGFVDEKVIVMLAYADFNKREPVQLDDAECIEVKTMLVQDAITMVLREQIFDAKTALAILWLATKKGLDREKLLAAIHMGCPRR